jgi:putative membrane protein
MMGRPTSGGGWAAWRLLSVTMVTFWGLVARVVVALARQPGPRHDPDSHAEDIGAQRFARGEIDEEGYATRLTVLRAHR